MTDSRYEPPFGGCAAHVRPQQRRRTPGRVLPRARWLVPVLLLFATVARGHDPGPAIAGPPTGHASAEGLTLVSADTEESVRPSATCPESAPVRAYEVLAIEVEITLNRYLDHDPEGRMYVLRSEVERVRDEELRNRTARSNNETEPAVSVGLQGDAIQPLVLRVNQGECLVVTLINQLTDEPASFHLHGSGLYLPDSGRPALASEPGATAAPGDTVRYAWWVPEDQPEGTHYLHSHGATRSQTAHGLFGAVIIEPAGSRYLDPRTGEPMESGWDAIIEDPAGSAFREFALFYHEIGNERYRHRNAQGRLVVQIDPLTGAYRPGDRAINYRSEPFMNRLQLQIDTIGSFDESLAYSSYTFGDPATPIARSYLGDPVKQRLIHGGSEVFHVHHVHGGSTRWRRQSGAEPTAFDSGGDKHPPLLPDATERVDAQALGPSETFDVENECGSGGCQLGAGDYMIHCHVAHHYFAGMWMVWRVYNTLQDGAASTDPLPALRELPGRLGGVAPAVPSSELIGTAPSVGDERFTIDEATLAAWVERQLPPAGQPGEYDASVFDWVRDGTVYLGEPEPSEAWPGYRPAHPGERRSLLFDPRSGRLAYPLLSPHLGQRPPFAPGHGPAPFLEPPSPTDAGGHGPSPPGASGDGSLCPDGTQLQSFVIHAITLPIDLNARQRITDPSGQLYVLKEEEDEVRHDGERRTPLAIRANAGEDCVDVLFKSELEDTRENALLSKANIHIHFVQFDVQGSDGVTFGFNYEQSVRPFTIEGEAVVAASELGAATLTLTGSERFRTGALVGIGMDQTDTFEVRRIAAIEDGTLTFDRALSHPHAVGEIVSTEFVRYRWYPDVQFGTAYFHDHVAALSSWSHGLFGALISEPPGSIYTDPHTGEALRSGPVVDVRTPARLSRDIVGSFRELVLFLQDDNRLTQVGDSGGGSLNLRVEPLAPRADDRSTLFSSAVHGDPETPIFEAHAGDPLVIRGLVAATNDLHTLVLDGHPFPFEPFAERSTWSVSTAIGISERSDLYVPSAGGPHALPGDYLLRNGRIFKLEEGSWGLIRVTEAGDAALQSLPGVTPPEADRGVCPADAPVRRYEVAAIDLPLPFLGDGVGTIFALAAEADRLLSGSDPPEPLVLHIGVGDCLVVQLTNRTEREAVSWHSGGLVTDPAGGSGLAVGRSPGRFAAPGASATYTAYASPDVGEGVAIVLDGGDLLRASARGAYAAVVVGPAGARYVDPTTGAVLSPSAGWRVDVHPPNAPSYRDFTLMLHDADPVIGTAIMPYSQHVAGPVGINYRRAPLVRPSAAGDAPVTPLATAIAQQPGTPTLRVREGDRFRVHVATPHGEQGHVFSLEGHRWPLVPGMPGTTWLSSRAIGPMQSFSAHVDNGAGPAGAYLYGDHREPYREAGMWGVLQVVPWNDASEDPWPLR